MSAPSPARSTLPEILAGRAAEHPDRPFVHFGDCTYTYADVELAAGRLAAGLDSLGVRHGSRVAIFMANSAEFVTSIFGITRLGAIEVPLNTALKGRLLAYQLADAGATVVIASHQLLPRIVEIEESLPALQHIVVAGDGDAVGESLPMLEPNPDIALHAFADLLAERPAPIGELSYTDVAAIMYTSGTTGLSKGVLVTHGHCLSFAADWIVATSYESDDVLYGPLPLFHALAHTLGLVPVLITGSQMAIVERFSASAYWDDCRRYRATVGHGIFGMVPILLNQPPRADDRDHSVRCFYIGPSAASSAFEERFGALVVEVFGMTETGVVTATPYGQGRPGSCGRPNSASFEVRVVDDDDEEVATGEVGEIVLRPLRPFTMMAGYYNKPEATVEAWRNLWFHTGDYARIDAEGYLYFVDRKKDSIRRRGENISSFEVERAINQHPAILECAVIAVPSPLGEDEIAAVLVAQPDCTIDFANLTAFLDNELPYFMVPRYLREVPALPKTANEKIQKFELRSTGADGITDDTWDRVAAGVPLERESRR